MWCSESTYARLEQQVIARKESLRYDEQALGEAEKYMFSDEFAREHRISPYGRTTPGEEGWEYHAAPILIDDESLYESNPPDFIDFMSSFFRGEEAVPPIAQMCAEVALPVAKYSDSEDHTGVVEEFLFKNLANQWGTFSVLNPSPSTIRRTKAYTVVYVVTSEEARVWTQDFLAKQGIRVPCVDVDGTVGPLYMGSNGSATWHSMSVALVPNPYSPTPLYDRKYVQEVWNGVKMTYWKKDREISSMLNDRSGNYLYPPQNIPGSGGAYFIESNFPMALSPTTDEYPLPHSPFFLEKLPDYEKEGMMEVSRENGVVYDIKGEGTYLSRRYAHPEWEWAPLVPFGVVAFTRYTTVLKKQVGTTSHVYSDYNIVLHSRERGLVVKGPYHNFRMVRNVVVTVDRLSTSDEIKQKLLEVAWDIDVTEADLYPYSRGYAFVISFKSEEDQKHFSKSGAGVYGDLVFRVETKFFTYKKRMYSTRHVSRGLIFVPGGSSYPLPGFPPGYMTRTWLLDIEGDRTVLVPDIYPHVPRLPNRTWMTPVGELQEFKQKHVALVFALVPELYFFYGRTVMGLKRWTESPTTLTYIDPKSAPEPAESFISLVHKVINMKRVDRWEDRGATLPEIASLAENEGITVEKVRQLCSPSVSVLVWRVGENAAIEWVSLSSISITLPGRSEGPKSINGLLVADVYNYVRTTRVGGLYFDGTYVQVAPFLKLLSLNGVFVEYHYLRGRLEIYFSLIT